MGKRELVALLKLSSWCLVMVKRLFLTVPRGCLRFVIVVFPDHTHLLFFKDDLTKFQDNSRTKGSFFKFKEFSRTKVKFKDFSRSVQTLFTSSYNIVAISSKPMLGWPMQ